MSTRRPGPAPIRLPALAAAAIAASAGCTVGPDFTPPSADTPEAWTGAGETRSERPLSNTPTPEPAHVGAWWTTFNDPTLTSLIERAAAGNLTLAQAQSRIRQARAAITVAASGLYPDIAATASGARSRSGQSGASSTANFFRAGFDASWEIDVFGGVRRAAEAAEADFNAAEYAHAATLVSLAGEIATTYFQLRGAQQQLALARQNLDAQRRTLELTEQRREAGFVSALDVANARANVTQTEASIPSFDAQAQNSILALGVLIGREPAALRAELNPDSPPPSIPQTVPIGLPSELLERRPDIRQAQAALHAATARVGVAVADQYPRFSLTGSIGTQGSKVESLGTVANNYWAIGPSVSLPIFTGGRIQGNIEQAREVAVQATLAYRQSVLTALQDVESSLVSFTREQQRRGALTDAVAANQSAVDLSLRLYSAGRIDFLNVLTAQRQLFSTQALLSQSETAVATDLIALFKALGGGWDPGPVAAAPPPPAAPPGT